MIWALRAGLLLIGVALVGLVVLETQRPAPVAAPLVVAAPTAVVVTQPTVAATPRPTATREAVISIPVRVLPTFPPRPTATPVVEGVPSRVEVVDNFFEPGEVRIRVGNEVTWRHAGQIAHTVTTFGAQAFDSGRIVSGERFSRLFEEAGTFDYVCVFHAGMRGVVIVEP
jgi:plastocyanin